MLLEKFEDKLAALYIQQKSEVFFTFIQWSRSGTSGALHIMDLTKDMITYRNHVQPISHGVDPKQ
jgi:TPP-dependent pyruvate/acetoin dehydrogenase alpha subunit